MTQLITAPQQLPEAVNPTRERLRQARMDDVSVGRHIQHYPEEIKDSVMWLAAFFRERCKSRYDILTQAAATRGFSRTSDNYFYRVLTGRYFKRDDAGKLVGSVENLTQIIDALRAGVQLEERAGKTPFIETGTWQRVRDYIDLKRAPETVCKFGVIIGPTGAQKTACLKQYAHLNNHGTVVHVEAPHTPSMGAFLEDLASRYGHGRWTNAEHRMRAIALSVSDKRTIIVDNVQRLHCKKAGNNQPIFSYLQKLQDDTGCTIILSFAAIEAGFLTSGLENGYFEQFEGRAGGRRNFLVLDDFMPREDIVQIAEAHGLQDLRGKVTIRNERSEWISMDAVAYLERICREPGRCRIYFDALQAAKQLAAHMKEPMQMSHILAVRGEEVA